MKTRKPKPPGTFPTVKTSPWAKGRKQARHRFQLWSNEVWKQLEKIADKGGKKAPFKGEVLHLICEVNLRLYGRP